MHLTGSNPVLTTQKTTKMVFLYPHRASFKNLKQSGGGMVDAVQLTQVANESILPVERSDVWWE